MADAALRLQQTGAESIVICTNTVAISSCLICNRICRSILHIADATAKLFAKRVYGKSRFIRNTLYHGRRLLCPLPIEHYGLEVITPDAAARQLVHNVIFNELCVGEEKATSRAQYREIMAALVQQGAEGIIFGCTEIAMLVDQTDAAVPVFDTTTLHASYAAEWALA